MSLLALITVKNNRKLAHQKITDLSMVRCYEVQQFRKKCASFKRMNELWLKPTDTLKHRKKKRNVNRRRNCLNGRVDDFYQRKRMN